MRYDLFIRGYAKLGKYQTLVRHVINHVRIVVGIDHTDPLVHAGPTRDVSWLQGQSRKSLIDIGDDGARLVECEITMPQDRHAIEGMERQMAWLAHLRFEVLEGVGHLFVGENQPHDVDECAAWKPVNDWIGHITLLDSGCCRCKTLVIFYCRQNGLAASRSASCRSSPMSLRSRTSWTSSRRALRSMARASQMPRVLRALLNINRAAGLAP